jgi:murein DD-endopeptidase MepM/ murein hydrolase activator NlpD
VEKGSSTVTQRARLRWLFRGGLVLAAGLLLWYSGVEAGLWHAPAPAAPQGAPLSVPPVPSAVPTTKAAAAPPPATAQGTTLYLPILSVGPPVSVRSPTRSASPDGIPPAERQPSPTPTDEAPKAAPAAAAAADRATAAAEPDLPAGRWIWPVRGRISQAFSPSHRAIDIVADHGTLVQSADAGQVVYARWETSGYGYLVIVDHGDGYRTYYGHLYGFYVDVGQSVERGDLLGQLGNTGDSTGPHLHFEIRYRGSHLDPLDVLPDDGQ